MSKQKVNNNLSWEKRITKCLVGRKIIQTRYLTIKESEHCGFHHQPLVIILDNGEWLMPMSDDEGNDGGAMSTSYDELSTIPVMRG